MNFTKKTIRQPDEYRELISARSNRKWGKIIELFLQKRVKELALSHKSGTRGRIFEFLALELFQKKQIRYKSEPIFNHIEPNNWYINFTEKHNIKLRKHDFYNSDMFLEDGTWVEITLSENTAYKKLFRYGHQAENLLVLWLDVDNGLHKKICQPLNFPNAEVKSIENFGTLSENTPEELEVYNYLKLLKNIRKKIL